MIFCWLLLSASKRRKLTDINNNIPLLLCVYWLTCLDDSPRNESSYKPCNGYRSPLMAITEPGSSCLFLSNYNQMLRALYTTNGVLKDTVVRSTILFCPVDYHVR